MKKYLIGAVFFMAMGAFLHYKLNPPPEPVTVEKIKTVDKTITKIKRIVEPGGKVVEYIEKNNNISSESDKRIESWKPKPTLYIGTSVSPSTKKPKLDAGIFMPYDKNISLGVTGSVSEEDKNIGIGLMIHF